MKLYPFFKSQNETESALCCFQSYLCYYGYQADKRLLEYIFQAKESGISLMSFLAGLDYFEVVYSLFHDFSLLPPNREGIIIKYHQQYMLCLGKVWDYLFIMSPCHGYRLIREADFVDWPVEACIQLKFLGDFPYFKKRQISKANQLLFLFFWLEQTIVNFFCVSSFNFVLISQVLGLVLFLAVSKKWFLKKTKQFKTLNISETALKQYEKMMNLKTSLYASLLMMAALSFDLWFYTGTMNLFFIFLVIFFECMLIWQTKKNPLHLDIGILFWMLLLLEFAELVRHHQDVCFETVCILSCAHLFFSLKFYLTVQQIHGLNTDAFYDWYTYAFFDFPVFKQIESIGFASYHFDGSTLILGEEKARKKFFESLNGTELFINDTLLKKQQLLSYLDTVVFRKNCLHLDGQKTVEAVFSERIERILELLEALDCFDYCLYLNAKVGNLDKSIREIFGFLDILTGAFSFCVIQEAFLYQSEQMTVKCLKLLHDEKISVKVILAIPTIKLMNQKNICAIIKHEKVR